MHFPVVDVRDVAASHIAAIEHSEAADGQRYICCTQQHVWIGDIAAVLRKEFAKFGYKVTSRTIGYCLFRIVACCDRQAKTVVPFWGREQNFTNKKICTELGVKFYSAEEAILQMAYCLIRSGLIPNLLKEDEREPLNKKSS